MRDTIANRSVGSGRRLFWVALVLGSMVLLAPAEWAAPPQDYKVTEPTIGGLPLFAGWPKEQRPAAVLVVSGQTYGLLQPCGCTRPQLGGLERRAWFIQTLKDKGWPVAGIDLGDAYPSEVHVRSQGLLRYETMMRALHAMGYIAAGVGKTEIEAEIDRVLSAYALQTDQPPVLLAANLIGQNEGKPISQQERFQPAGLPRSLVQPYTVAKVGTLSIGVVGLIGRAVAEELESAHADPSITFVKNVQGKIDNAIVLRQTLAAMAAQRPDLYVLLYQGGIEEAQRLSQDFPQFQIIICRSEDSEPPAQPVLLQNGSTLLVQIGHKGRYVGTIGVFAHGGYRLHYQLVPLTEYYVTPGDDAQAQGRNPVLPILQRYAERVRDRDLLNLAPKRPHQVQIQHPQLNLSYYGSQRCQNCHAADYRLWEKSAHSHALDTLATKAVRPTLRQYDPECVRCHTVGFEYNTGFVNTTKTPLLQHVGCESCHGPGSGHATNPQHRDLQLLMSPWKEAADNRLPDLATMRRLAALSPIEQRQAEQQLPADQRRTAERVATMCMKCHDHDNDPHFNLYKYWPKIAHGFRGP